MNRLSELVELVGWRDVVDVLLVAILLYYLLLLIRGTRAVQILLGILVLSAVYYVARIGEFAALATIIEKFLIVLPFAVIVLFQQEIRRGLASLGRTPVFGSGGRETIESTVAEIAHAASRLADRRIGALVVIERQQGLRNYVEHGVAIDGLVSYDLLVNLFVPETPLHDGAAIVQGDRIAAASCVLPLSSNPELSKELGTRHRAALGITEETDALAVVVSEETGQIAFALGGRLEQVADSDRLRSRLLHELAPDPAAQRRSRAR